MTRFTLNLLIALVMVVGIGGLVYAQKRSSVSEAPLGTATTSATLDQVAAHNTRESCWTIINGNIYDLTSWIPRHPGGEEAILGLCGTDGSARFNNMHGGSAQQEAILAGFKISGTGEAAAPSATVPAGTEAGDDNDGSGRNRRGRDDDRVEDSL